MNNRQNCMTFPGTKEQTKTAASASSDVEFYGTKEVAKLLGCSIPTARETMQRSDFPLIKVGRKLLVSKKALEEWASKRRV